MEDEYDVPAIRPLPGFGAKNPGQMSGAYIFQFVVLVDHDRHVMRQAGRNGRQCEEQQNTQAALHRRRFLAGWSY